jgi:patatin-like phospholipase/acyl hydrolase
MLEQRIKSQGKKKILCCDGGGILGLMSIEILAKIEKDQSVEVKLSLKRP